MPPHRAGKARSSKIGKATYLWDQPKLDQVDGLDDVQKRLAAFSFSGGAHRSAEADRLRAARPRSHQRLRRGRFAGR